MYLHTIILAPCIRYLFFSLYLYRSVLAENNTIARCTEYTVWSEFPLHLFAPMTSSTVKLGEAWAGLSLNKREEVLEKHWLQYTCQIINLRRLFRYGRWEVIFWGQIGVQQLSAAWWVLFDSGSSNLGRHVTCDWLCSNSPERWQGKVNRETVIVQETREECNKA